MENLHFFFWETERDCLKTYPRVNNTNTKTSPHPRFWKSHAPVEFHCAAVINTAQPSPTPTLAMASSQESPLPQVAPPTDHESSKKTNPPPQEKGTGVQHTRTTAQPARPTTGAGTNRVAAPPLLYAASARIAAQQPSLINENPAVVLARSLVADSSSSSSSTSATKPAANAKTSQPIRLMMGRPTEGGNWTGQSTNRLSLGVGPNLGAVPPAVPPQRAQQHPYQPPRNTGRPQQRQRATPQYFQQRALSSSSSVQISDVCHRLGLPTPSSYMLPPDMSHATQETRNSGPTSRFNSGGGGGGGSSSSSSSSNSSSSGRSDRNDQTLPLGASSSHPLQLTNPTNFRRSFPYLCKAKLPGSTFEITYATKFFGCYWRNRNSNLGKCLLLLQAYLLGHYGCCI